MRRAGQVAKRLLIAALAVAPLGHALAQALPPLPAAPGAAPARPGPQLTPPRPPTAEALVPMRGTALLLEAGAGRVLQLPAPAGSVFAADPRVAEVRPASPLSLFVFGVAPGRTTIAALDAAGAAVATYDVTVRPSAYGAIEAQGALRRLLPGREIRIETRTNGLVATGEVQNAAEANLVMSTLRSFIGDDQRVENRLTVLGSTQVNLRVRIAEVSREVTRQFGINWQALGSIGRFGIAAATNLSLADAASLPAQIAGGYRGAVNIDGVIDLLAQDRLITILAEPNLTAVSGETASFLVGGEFPIPVNQQNNQVTIEFKQYGVSLAFVPTVLSAERIVMRVRPEVSDLSEQGAVRLSAANGSIQIPALLVRRAETTVELGSGQSFAIAGLLQDTSRNLGRAVPGIGELPILGALFRSDRFQRNETELVIVVTPFVVRPQNSQDQIRSPLDQYVPPTDSDRLLMGRQVGNPNRAVPFVQRPVRPAQPPGLAGFVLF